MLLAHLDTPDFLSTYFPQIGEMEELFATLAAAFRDAAERNRRMRDWAAHAESLRDRLLPAPDTSFFQAPGGRAIVEMTIPGLSSSFDRNAMVFPGTHKEHRSRSRKGPTLANTAIAARRWEWRLRPHIRPFSAAVRDC